MIKLLSTSLLLFSCYFLHAGTAPAMIDIERGDSARVHRKDTTDVKDAKYFKGRVLAKFKPGYLTLMSLTDTITYKDLTKILDKKHHSIQFNEMKEDVQGIRPLVKLSKALARKILTDTTGTAYEDIYDVVLIYCKEGKEKQVIKRLLGTGMVEYAEPDYLVKATSAPNDQSYWLQSALENPNYQNNQGDIDIERAWQTNTGSSDVKVAIIDSGIDYTNLDLGNGNWNNSGAKVVGGYDYFNNNSNPMDTAPDSHGTSVAGIIGAYRNNGNLVAGIAGGDVTNGNPGVKLYALKVGNATGGTSSAFYAALIDASRPVAEGGLGCHIANYSSGSYTYSNTSVQALRYAARKDLLFVAPKGNDNTNSLHYPSDYRDNWVLSVGSSTPGDSRVKITNNPYSPNWGSNWGNNIDVVAPGLESEIFTTGRGVNGFQSFGGTSASAPIVAGIAALLKSQRPDLNRDDLEQLIKISADKVRQDLYTYVNGYNDEVGYGRVSAGNAMDLLKAPYKLLHKTATFWSGMTVNQPTTELMQFNSGRRLSGSYYGKRYKVTFTVPKLFCGGESYIWPRIEGEPWLGWTTMGWSPNNDEEAYAAIENETANTVDLVTYIYYIERTASGAQVNKYYPCDLSSVRIAYTSLGSESNYMPDQITGPQLLCTNQTYSIDGLPQGTVVNWSTDAPHAVSMVPSGNQVVITKLQSTSMQLTGTYQTSCGTKTAKMFIEVGTPDYIALNGNEFPLVGNSEAYTIPSMRGVLSVDWYVTGGSSSLNPNQLGEINITFNEAAGYTIQAKITTECGIAWSEPFYVNPYQEEDPWEDYYMYSLYPNPSDNELTVEYVGKDKSVKGPIKKEVSVLLLDAKAQILKSGSTGSDKNKITINTADVAEGTYYLHIKEGKKVYKRQILIKH
jgi:subtilisin family serine protease